MARSPVPGSAVLRIGRVLRAHGLNGAVQVELLTDFPDRFTPGSRVDIDGRTLTIAGVEAGERRWTLTFAEITDRTAARRLRDRYLTLPLEAARPLPEAHFYHFELVGLTVVDERSGRPLGRVAEVLTYPANDVLRVTSGSVEVLVPMVKSVVRAIDTELGRIVVHFPTATEV